VKQIEDEQTDAVCEEIERMVGVRRVYPLSFCIPESLVLNEPPTKRQSAGKGISRGRRQYAFDADQQRAYYEDYQQSYFGLTYKKGGWDCMRHLEVMANGCLPYFPGIADCPRYTMVHYPKALMREIEATYARAVELHGYDLSFDAERYRDILTDYNEQVRRILDHVQRELTTTAMARYVLGKAGRPDAKRILYLSHGRKPDYICDLLFHGLRSILGEGCIDAKKLWWMYDSADPARTGTLYGRGFTYSRHLPELEMDRGSIRGRLRKREFDLVVFGSINRCSDLLPTVRRYYDRDEVLLIDGEDQCKILGWSKKHNPPQRRWATARKLPANQIVKQGIYFKRELDHAVLMAYNTV
jgi:hypothetical protein